MSQLQYNILFIIIKYFIHQYINIRFFEIFIIIMHIIFNNILIFIFIIIYDSWNHYYQWDKLAIFHIIQ